MHSIKFTYRALLHAQESYYSVILPFHPKFFRNTAVSEHLQPKRSPQSFLLLNSRVWWGLKVSHLPVFTQLGQQNLSFAALQLQQVPHVRLLGTSSCSRWVGRAVGVFCLSQHAVLYALSHTCFEDFSCKGREQSWGRKVFNSLCLQSNPLCFNYAKLWFGAI